MTRLLVLPLHNVIDITNALKRLKEDGNLILRGV
jgi:hypothetical protein